MTISKEIEQERHWNIKDKKNKGKMNANMVKTCS
jgi:hypothetical protein